MKIQAWCGAALCAALAVALPGPPAAAQQAPLAGLSAALDTLAAHSIKDDLLPGFAVAIIQDGQLRFSGGFGQADLENDVRVTPGTVFRLGPVTELYTAAAALRLAEKGRLKLGDDAARSSRELADANRHATLRQLLAHVSGLPDAAGPRALENEGREMAPGAWIRLFASDPPLFAPGEAWWYSRLDGFALQAALERAGELPFEDLAAQEAQEAGAAAPVLLARQPVVPHRARGYGIFRSLPANAPEPANAGGAATGLGTNVVDLAKFVEALRAGKVLRKESLDALLAPTALAGGDTVDFGLGARLGRVGTHRLWGQCGSGYGFSAAVACYPDDRLVVAVLENADTPLLPAWRLQERIARPLLGLPLETAQVLPTPPADLVRCAGEWVSPEGNYRIYPEGPGMVVGLPGTGTNPPLLWQGDGRYFVYGPEFALRFLPSAGTPREILHYESGFFMGADRRAR